MTQPKQPTLALLDDIVDAFNAHDVARVVSFFADDGEMLLAAGPDAWGTRLAGREAIAEGLAARFAAVPDIRWSDGRNWVFGDKALSEWRVTGTPVAGGRVDCMGCDLWEFRDGLVRCKDTYYKQRTA